MHFFTQNIITENQRIELPLFQEKQVEVWIKREDKIHPFVSGNKFRKLKYNLIQAKIEKKQTILTFGGAYSNHIVATAVACNLLGMKSVGVIRGEELAHNFQTILQQNNTLQTAYKNGMEFEFVSRNDFRNKNNKEFISRLKTKFGDFYGVPEGGTNALAVKGCEEILTEQDQKFNYICTAVGTGGTVAGLINACEKHQKILGFSALKGDFLVADIQKLTPKRTNWSLQTDCHFGGYAKYNDKLISFINEFKRETNVLLDPIYTAKMMFGIIALIRKNYFAPKTKILAIHTGGLQGIAGINRQLQFQLKEIINY